MVKLSKTAASGAVALIFLILGFQAALFLGNVFRRGGEKEPSLDSTSPYISESSGFTDSYSDNSTIPPAGISPPETSSPGISPPETSSPGISSPETSSPETSPPGISSQGTSSPEISPQGTSSQGISSPGKTTVGLPDKKYNSFKSVKSVKYSRREVNKNSLRSVNPKLYDLVRGKPTPESFPFNPNDVTHSDLCRLGFSPKQADVIINYRSKGGRFRRKSDFAKMYVVSDSVYARLKPYIDIPKIDINTADSISLLSLSGIGPYYAHKILVYRKKIGGKFSSNEQLMEIEGIDSVRYSKMRSDLSGENVPE